MNSAATKPILKHAIVDTLLDCGSAAHCIKWLFEKYDAGEHEWSIEAIRLLTSILNTKLTDALEKAESIEAEARHD
ncbi:hypothetical protein [Burkholderia ubonensis]|uniref:Uncharacterized protein n=1 Tax=Burkholderia ubonensis subsp. mesacidophila TaxID=265293 RepID=A0A2A4FHA7_9BURK|nr:hypothetical protein [Burkholderia ubonensis]PCE31974.1 hypothetical protein BZL54_12800 [Burkholderia ubonensis subsp. mesacidophila]